tara:strand:- start:281 stop:535 length:255 start_codon:yes stop_codon:yes gene_type:complete
MSSDSVKVKLCPSTRIRATESDKSYNLRYLGYMTFVPKSLCQMETLEIQEGMYRWRITIPLWLLSKNDELKTIVELLKKEEDDD